MKTLDQATLYRFRKPKPEEGSAVWRFLTEAGGLDVNTPYCYIMWCDYFADTCVVAEGAECGTIVGFLSSFVAPGRPDTLFVWQMAVHRNSRGQKLASAMLLEAIRRLKPGELKYVEATVSPGNQASMAVFRSLAEARKVPLAIMEGYPRQFFPNPDSHEPELLVRVGPLSIN